MNWRGRGGIRTHEGLAPLAVFKTAALNHSATLPYECSQGLMWGHERTKRGFCYRFATILASAASRYNFRGVPEGEYEIPEENYRYHDHGNEIDDKD